METDGRIVLDFSAVTGGVYDSFWCSCLRVLLLIEPYRNRAFSVYVYGIRVILYSAVTEWQDCDIFAIMVSITVVQCRLLAFEWISFAIRRL
jgi:hypothetical protein